MYEMLDMRVPKLDFMGESPLSEVLKFLSQHVTDTYGASGDESFTMTIWPDTVVLWSEDISSLDEVLISDIVLDGITLRNALKLIFRQTAEPALTYVIQNEVMLITTLEEATSEHMMLTRVYPVGHLLAVETQQVLRDGITGEEGPAAHLISLVQEFTPPALFWGDDIECGTIYIFGGNLVIRQTHSGHQEIVRLLNLLTQSIESR